MEEGAGWRWASSVCLAYTVMLGCVLPAWWLDPLLASSRQRLGPYGAMAVRFERRSEPCR